MVKLECKSPVPSDIDIAQAAPPLPISEIAKAAGLTPDQYDLYGNTKAKVGVRCIALFGADCYRLNDCYWLNG